ncbi:unnamed protein product [Brassica oleracea var. botrytis]
MLYHCKGSLLNQKKNQKAESNLGCDDNLSDKDPKLVIDFERSLSMGSRANRVGERWNQMGCEEKSSVIQEEIKRVSKLPSNSVYAVHRLKVLNKINELLSVQRTLSQEKELELLFTQLSL